MLLVMFYLMACMSLLKVCSLLSLQSPDDDLSKLVETLRPFKELFFNFWAHASQISQGPRLQGPLLGMSSVLH